MLSARCPSCGSPVVFRSSASLAAVCPACSTTLVRQGADLRAYGKAAPIARELSPIQVGATGKYKNRGFLVVGALRKARERVRWNEWWLLFDDGAGGWLGEGNGLFQLFLAADGAGDAPRFEDLHPSTTLRLAGHEWRVAEVNEAHVVAAEGELPSPPPRGPAPYADLRDADGAVATLDYADRPPTLYVGKVVDLVDDLGMEGLKPFTGWSDEAITAFAGPEVAAVKQVQCPNCAAPVGFHPAVQSAAIVCAHCGSDLGVEPVGEQLREIQRAASQVKQPLVPLGTKGTLDDVEWEAIGAMVRYVVVDGREYSWTEILLWNPWRGCRWLVWGTEGHWMLVQLLPEVLQPYARKVEHDGRVYRRYQGGQAIVAQVLGEFTWEVHVGDRADTVDYVAPPRMLSSERTRDEVTWSLGVWLDPDEVAEAFGVQVPQPWGTAPNQPNPWDRIGAGRIVAQMAVGFLVAALAIVGLQASADPQPRLDVTFGLTNTAVWVSEPFEIAGKTSWTGVDHELPGGRSVALLTLVNQTTGRVYDLQPRSGTDARDVAVVRSPDPGRYVARLEATGEGAGVNWAPGNFRVRVVEGVSPLGGMGWWFAILVVAFPFSLPFLVLALHSSFENMRWSNSDGS